MLASFRFLKHTEKNPVSLNRNQQVIQIKASKVCEAAASGLRQELIQFEGSKLVSSLERSDITNVPSGVYPIVSAH